jgi:hypothetical protein
MSDQGVRVTFENLKRAANGNVLGRIRLKWIEIIDHRDVQLVNVTKDFDFKDEQQIFNESFDVRAVRVTIQAKLFKRDDDHVCVTGRVEGKALGFAAHKDLDNNCAAIP